MKAPLCKLGIWEAWFLFTQPFLKTTRDDGKEALHTPGKWQYLPCTNHTVNWPLLCRGWGWLPGQIWKLENIMPGLKLPVSMFESHKIQIASGRLKTPDPEAAQSGALSWPAPDLSSQSSLDPPRLPHRTTTGRGPEWGNQSPNAPGGQGFSLPTH